MEEKKEHWITSIKAIYADNIYELAKSLDAISKEHFIFATQIFPKSKGYDCLIHYKDPPKEPIKDFIPPTKKQIKFLEENRFKIPENLTKEQATRMIKEYIERKNKQIPRKSREYDNSRI